MSMDTVVICHTDFYTTDQFLEELIKLWDESLSEKDPSSIAWVGSDVGAIYAYLLSSNRVTPKDLIDLDIKSVIAQYQDILRSRVAELEPPRGCCGLRSAPIPHDDIRQVLKGDIVTDTDSMEELVTGETVISNVTVFQMLYSYLMEWTRSFNQGKHKSDQIFHTYSARRKCTNFFTHLTATKVDGSSSTSIIYSSRDETSYPFEGLEGINRDLATVFHSMSSTSYAKLYTDPDHVNYGLWGLRSRQLNDFVLSRYLKLDLDTVIDRVVIDIPEAINRYVVGSVYTGDTNHIEVEDTLTNEFDVTEVIQTVFDISRTILAVVAKNVDVAAGSAIIELLSQVVTGTTSAVKALNRYRKQFNRKLQYFEADDETSDNYLRCEDDEIYRLGECSDALEEIRHAESLISDRAAKLKGARLAIVDGTINHIIM